jgi:hypothetical protein
LGGGGGAGESWGWEEKISQISITNSLVHWYFIFIEKFILVLLDVQD